MTREPHIHREWRRLRMRMSHSEHSSLITDHSVYLISTGEIGFGGFAIEDGAYQGRLEGRRLGGDQDGISKAAQRLRKQVVGGGVDRRNGLAGLHAGAAAGVE